MKKLNIIITLLAFVALSFTVTSCGSGGSKSKTPAQMEMAVWEQIQKGNYDKAFDLWFDNANIDAGQNTAETKATLKEIFNKVKEKNEEKGGIAKVELLDETISEDGTSAKVTVKCTYNDGTTDEPSSKYVLVDGKWKGDMAK